MVLQIKCYATSSPGYPWHPVIGDLYDLVSEGQNAEEDFTLMLDDHADTNETTKGQIIKDKPTMNLTIRNPQWEIET